MTLYSTLELARKVETSEALNHVAFVEAHRKIFTHSKASHQRIDTGYAVYIDADSPLTQAFGLGFAGTVEDDEIIRLEDFYKQRRCPVNIEVSHLADASFTSQLAKRGYQIVGYSDVLIKSLSGQDAHASFGDDRIGIVTANEVDTLATSVARGFADGGDFPQSLTQIFQTYFHQPNCTCFIARIDGEAAGGAAVFINGTLAILGAASTLPKFRGRGLQTDLLRCRLNFAASRNCELAAVTTLPGTVSQRNVQRQGFQMVYARTKFMRNS